VWPWKQAQGFLRSLKMAPFDRSRTISYMPSIVWRYLVSSARYSDLLVKKSRNCYTPPVFSTPEEGDPVGISWRCLMLIKLEWLCYRVVKKTMTMLNRFHLIPERHGRTDGRTDRQTDRRTDRIAISLSRVSVLTRDKKGLVSRLNPTVGMWSCV